MTEIQQTNPSPADPPPAVASNPQGVSFHDVLSALNPLQYLPVIGSIYRVVTGDVIPEPLRIGGSMVVSGLLAGPVGLAMNIATTIAEKVSGIDPEQIIAAKFHDAASPPADQAPPSAGQQASANTDMRPRLSLALNARQLAAYGVSVGATGDLRLGSVEGADVLNMIELTRLGAQPGSAAA